MDDSQLKTIVKSRIEKAATALSQSKKDREKAREYYDGELFGNEEEGFSQVVSHDTAEAVESMMPGLLKIFTSGEKTVSFDPMGPEDVDAAEQATDFVNYIWNKKNKGFLNFHSWFKDALLERLGVIKVWWDDVEESRATTYTDVLEEEIELIQADPNTEIVEIIEKEVLEDDSGFALQVYDVKCRTTEIVGGVTVECIPADEFLYDENCKGDLDKSFFLSHHCRKTISDLVAEGFDKDVLEGLSLGADAYGNAAEKELEGEDLDPAMREVWVSESYIRVDYDGDGIAELRKVIIAGDHEILVNEEVDGQPFCAISPILASHKLEGKSLYDQTADIQKIKSTLLRQTMDNLYLSNKPRTIVDDTKVNLDDLLNPQVGGVIRTKDINAVREVATPFTAAASAQMIEYWDTAREQRTGVTRYNQGLDANSLNKTATGINIIDQAGQQRKELIARVFAEVGVAPAFRKIYELVCKHQDKQEIIRLRGQFVTIDPTQWNHRMDMTVTVGLGTGNKDQQLAHIMTKIGIDREIIQMQGGMNGPLIKAEHVYNTLEKLVECMGLKSVEQYYAKPEMGQPPEPKPDPNAAMMEMQAQAMQMQMQMEQARQQHDMQLKQEKAQADIRIAEYKAQAQIEIDLLKAEQQNKIAADKALNEAELKMKTAINEAHLDRDKAETDAYIKAQVNNGPGQTGV